MNEGSLVTGSDVLFVADSPLDLPTGGGRTRIISEIRAVRGNGFKASLLCFVAADKIIKRRSRLLQARKALESEAGCNVLYVPQLPLTRMEKIAKLNDRYKAKVIGAVARRNGSALAHTHSVGAGIAALMAQELQPRLRIVADMHGAAPEEYMLARGLQRPDRNARRLAEREAALIRKADGVVVVSESMRRHFSAKYGVDTQDAMTVPCCTEFEHEAAIGMRDRRRAGLGIMGRPVVTYLGSSEEYQMPREMCALFSAVANIVDEAFFLVISHDGAVFENEFRSRGIKTTNYRILGANRSEVPGLLLAADIGFLLRGDSVVNQVAFPTKFAEYCAAGVPVVTTPYVGDVTRLVEGHDVGLIVELDDRDAAKKISGFLIRVMRNRSSVASRCRTFASSNLSWETAGKSVTSLYRRLIDG